MTEKTPFFFDAPEWQLWENMQSSYASARAFANDAENLQRMFQEACDRGNKYKDLLDKLKQ